MGDSDRPRSPLNDTWLPEIISYAQSLFSLLVTVILLKVYDHQPIVNWHGITLNTAVSLLSLASKAGLMNAVRESISQWKWILFSEKQRRLIEFDTIDSASRGTSGSLKLIWRTKGARFVCIGALITVVGLCFDPFLQQLIQNESRQVFRKDNATFISRAQRYSKGSETHVQSEGRLRADADFAMQSAVLYGLSQPIDAVSQQLSLNCSSGNCDWPSYHSLAVCSTCQDVTSRLTKSRSTNLTLFMLLDDENALAQKADKTIFTLPNGLYIDNPDGWQYGYGFTPSFSVAGEAQQNSLDGATLMTTFSTGNTSNTNVLQDIDTLIVATSMIEAFPDPENPSAAWPDLPVRATECGLYYCVNAYESRVSNGLLQETITPIKNATRSPESWQVSTDQTAFLNQWQLHSLEFGRAWQVPRTDLMLGDGFNVSQAAVDGISAYLNTLLTTDRAVDVSPRITGYLLNNTSFRTNFQFKPSAMQPLYDSRSINETFQALALSMSNAIRAGSDGQSQILGNLGVAVPFHNIQWKWIYLPLALELLAAVCLAITMHYAKRNGVPVWKSSSLAVLSRGPEVAEVFTGADTLQMMKDRARQRLIRLPITTRKDDEGYAQLPLAMRQEEAYPQPGLHRVNSSHSDLSTKE